MAEEEHKGLTFFDGVLIAGGGLIALIVAFAALHFVVGLVWAVVKLLVVVAVIVVIARLLFRRRA